MTIYVFGYPVLVHWVMETLGMFVAFRYYLWLKRKRGDTLESTNRLGVLVGAILGSVIGSHLLGALENIPEWRQSAHPWLYLAGNKTLVGGLVGGLIGVELVKKLIGERQNTGDLFTFPLIMGMICGRIGCFSAGIHEETYGLPTTLPWAMDLGDGIPRHPVTLYEILWLLCIALFLVIIGRCYVLAQGASFKIFLILYLVFRLLLDFIKPGWRYFLGLGSIQLVCVLGLLYYWKYISGPRLLITTKQKHAS